MILTLGIILAACTSSPALTPAPARVTPTPEASPFGATWLSPPPVSLNSSLGPIQPPLSPTGLAQIPTPPAPGRTGTNRVVWAISSLARIAYRWQGDLYTAYLDGSDTIRLTEHGTAAWRFSWSPNGRTLLYGVVLPGGDPNIPVQILMADSRGSNGVWFLDGQRVPVTWSWSPDGRRLVFNANGSWLVNMDGSGLRRLELPPTGDNRRVPGVGPWLDNERVFYASHCGTSCSRVGLVNVDTGESTLLGEMGPFDFDTSPDTKTMVYAGGPGSRVYLLDLENARRQVVYVAFFGQVYDVLWLDQEHIAFSEHDSTSVEPPGSYHGYVLDLATGSRVELEGLYLVGKSSFSPDRRFFLYAPQKSPSAVNPRIYVDLPEEDRGLRLVEIGTGRRQTISKPGAQLNFSNWGWSSDGQKIFFTKRLLGQTDNSIVSLWSAEPDGSSRRLLAPNHLTPPLAREESGRPEAPR